MSAPVPTYEQLFSRNIGVFTPEQQERIRGLRIAIAGCGGLGGPVAHLLARLGVGEIRLADPEVFESSNINRQWGAYVDTIGQNKAVATAHELRRINPGLRTVVLADGLAKDTINGFLEGASAVVDALEFLETDVEARLHEAARTNGLWVFVAQGLFELNTGFAVDPAGIGVMEYIESAANGSRSESMMTVCFPTLPRGISMSDVEDAIEAGTTSVPSWCVPPVLDAAMVVSDIVSVLVHDSAPLAVFPNVRVQDTEDFSVRVCSRAPGRAPNG